MQDPATTRNLPVWEQEVTDEQGRRRFHGAFTGGFSAGYFNTVGSKEGWAPSEFKSSRGQRANYRQQAVEDFLDQDELDESRKTTITTKARGLFSWAAAPLSPRQCGSDGPSPFPYARAPILGPLPPESAGQKLDLIIEARCLRHLKRES